MTDFFPVADLIVVGIEKPHSFDAAGGDTVYGIARVKHPGIPWPPSEIQARQIRRDQYWNAHRCGEMPWRWALAVYDGEINQGSVVRLAQLALQTTEDGAIGPETIRAMTMSSLAADDEFRRFLALRIEAYTHDAGYRTFGHGWIARVLKIAQAGEHEPT